MTHFLGANGPKSRGFVRQPQAKAEAHAYYKGLSKLTASQADRRSRACVRNIVNRSCGKICAMGGVAIVVFSDLVDSTALLARLGDDRMDTIRRAHIKDVTDAVALGDGRVIKTLGDGVMSTFESALGALRAAAAIQAAVERLDVEQGEIGIAARVGVAAGEPIPDGDDLHGMPVVIASRLSSAAGAGEVLVQELVAGLVASRDGVALDAARDFAGGELALARPGGKQRRAGERWGAR
jgi:class 3 adenylate cyclase